MEESEFRLIKARKELLQIVDEYPTLYGLPDDELEKRRAELISKVVDWGQKNHDVLELLIDLGVSEKGWSRYRFLLEAIGPIGNPSVVPRIVKELKQYAKSKQDSLYGDILFKTLILLNTEYGYATIDRILRKPKWGRLVHEFLIALKEIPNPDYIPILVRIIEQTGDTVTPRKILVQMAQKDPNVLVHLLNHKAKKVRFAAVYAIEELQKEQLNSQIINQLRSILNDKQEDLLTRSIAAGILESLGLQVPREFRKPKGYNESEDLPRLVQGILFPETGDEGWALTEVVRKGYQKDHVRLKLTYSMRSLHADLALWTGCFWDHYIMGIQFKKHRKKNFYRLHFKCRARGWETDYIETERIIKNLDDIIRMNIQKLIESFGDEYQRTIRSVNRSIATGEPIFVLGGAHFWKIDREKIQKEGSCK